jgi:hypothetical protein
MSKISEASRHHIADENFAFPKERKEPIQGTSTWQTLGHFYLALTDGFPKLYLSHTVQG